MTDPSANTDSTAQSLAPMFISHGSPMLVARQSTPAFHFFVDELSKLTDGVRAIVMISAHWQTERPTISTAQRQETIHDFYGFPQPLYQLHYDVAGDPELAKQIADQIGSETDAKRGLDHGAWMPMILARPNADIPVFQLSMLGHGGPREHFELGKKLRGLRDLGVLVVASGAMTHNLRALDRNEGPIDPWAKEFTNWMVEKIKARDIDALLDYRSLAPHAAMAHPDDDHLMPFYVALGAASDDFEPDLLHDSYEFGNLAMTALRFYDQDELKTAA
ncbi:class III extradiol ring-cleavage dioxygenase [Thalassospira sp. ER-Se-21-Dark]|uniref:DODA-type extradiol aromatic ring-opening family dioxygenase n=1 Tax=Thalassospira sp. ER-Se-21-Dark TaxID=2585190 RepID=UPI001B30A770|nr:class III extradiol ring-cleavage dioxygenase [Thalassospira sp. ER-Se-21-Dark]MBP3126135.1 dioxygenase [Thalassospira sp. ER-Se-21-Dark]